MDNVFTQIHQYSFKNKFVAQYFSTFVIKKLINPTNSRFLYHIKLGGCWNLFIRPFFLTQMTWYLARLYKNMFYIFWRENEALAWLVLLISVIYDIMVAKNCERQIINFMTSSWYHKTSCNFHIAWRYVSRWYVCIIRSSKLYRLSIFRLAGFSNFYLIMMPTIPVSRKKYFLH